MTPTAMHNITQDFTHIVIIHGDGHKVQFFKIIGKNKRFKWKLW